MFLRVLNRIQSTSPKWKIFSFWVIRFLKSLIYILYMYLWKWNYTKTKQFLPKRSWFHSIQHPQKHIFSHLEQPNWWKKNLEFLKISKSRIQNIKSCITPDLLIRFSLNFVCKCLDTFKNCYEHQFFPSYIFFGELKKNVLFKKKSFFYPCFFAKKKNVFFLIKRFFLIPQKKYDGKNGCS